MAKKTARPLHLGRETEARNMTLVTPQPSQILRMLWALPCSIVGLALGAGVVGLGGTARRVGPTLEVALVAHQRHVPAWAAKLRFGGITFGHVIVGQSHEMLARLRVHERVHVRQYERLGPLFFIAYPASSLLAWLRGECPYRANRFEAEAFAVERERDRSASAP